MTPEVIKALFSRQVQRLEGALEPAEYPPPWIQNLSPLDIKPEVLLTDLGWNGKHRVLLDRHIEESGLRLEHLRAVRAELSRIAYPMFEGNLPLRGEHLMVGTVRLLSDEELEKLGLNQMGILIVRKLLPRDPGSLRMVIDFF